MSNTSGSIPAAVKPADAEAALYELKRGLLRHLEEAAEAADGALEPVTDDTLIIEDADGNPVQIERAYLEEGRLFVEGYEVIDPDDQCVPGDEAEINSEDLGRLAVETFLSVVKHFAP